MTHGFTASGDQDVAESLNIPNITDGIASALASDVEYRIHQVVEVRVCLLVYTRALRTFLRKLRGSCDMGEEQH